MGDKAITSAVLVLTAIVGVAIVAVLVSKQSDTANVLGAAGKSFSSIIGAAVAPVSGGSMGAGLPSLGNLGAF
jgi:uncharacterized membrane protein